MFRNLLNLWAVFIGGRHEARIRALLEQIKGLTAKAAREQEGRIFAENALALIREDYFALKMNHSKLQFSRLKDWGLEKERIVNDTRKRRARLLGGGVNVAPPGLLTSESADPLASQRGNAFVPVVLYLALMAMLAGLGLTVRACQCTSKAQAMHFRSEYGLLSGCIIETDRGDKVPLDNYRLLGD